MSGVKLIMNNYNHINKILKDCPDLDMDINEVKFKKLSSGKTNQSFLVEGDLKKYVLRLNSKKSLNYNIDRKRELEILKGKDLFQQSKKMKLAKSWEKKDMSLEQTPEGKEDVGGLML